MSSVSYADVRTAERIRAHYEVERELADRLRHAPREERRGLYSLVYDELFERVPDHPQLTRKGSAEDTRVQVGLQMRFLRHFLRPGLTFLEIGAGDCALSAEVARTARHVYAVDVSESISSLVGRPANLEIVVSDGVSIPVEAGSVDFAYSNQLMEHLHPEDAFEQLRNIVRALAPSGRYVCITPNRLSGPHDVSSHFDREATGFHIKEYTVTELARLFRAAGFAQARAYAQARGRVAPVPGPLAAGVEGAIGALPFGARRQLARAFPWRWALGIQIIGSKGH
jgi:SAM-dependent methyltransferase